MYGSRTEYGRNAIAMKMAYAGKSKICRYEIPYSVTGVIIASSLALHTGLKDKPKPNGGERVSFHASPLMGLLVVHTVMRQKHIYQFFT